MKKCIISGVMTNNLWNNLVIDKFEIEKAKIERDKRNLKLLKKNPNLFSKFYTTPKGQRDAWTTRQILAEREQTLMGKLKKHFLQDGKEIFGNTQNRRF